MDAGKKKIGRDEAVQIARTMARVITGRGKNRIVLELKDGPDDDALAAALLGPTGNLKAPTLKVGSTLLVGFNEAAYLQVFSQE